MSFQSPLRILVLVAACSVSLPVSARTTFNPFLSLSYAYSDNVAYVDDAGQDTADTSAQAGAGFSLEHTIKNGSLQLSAAARYTAYNDFDELDNTRYNMGLDFTKSRGRGTFGLSTTASRSQEQGRADSLEDVDVVLSRRTTRERYGFGATYSHDTASGNWQWNTGAGVAVSEYDDISGVPGAMPIDDRTSYRADLGFSKLLNRRTGVGADYNYQFFDLDSDVEETVHSLAFTVDHTVSRQVAVGFAIGAFERSQDTPTGEPDDLDQDGLFGNASVSRQFESTLLAVNLSRSATAGGSESGTSTNTALGVTLTSTVPGAKWNWRLAARAANRDPSLSSEEDLDTISFGASVNRRIGRVLSISLDGNWVEQSSDDPSRDDDGYYRTSIGLVWRPLGNNPISGG